MRKNQYNININSVVSKIHELEQISRTPDLNGDSTKGIFIDNISQQGLLKEIIMAEKLGHYVNRNKKQFDAFQVVHKDKVIQSLSKKRYSEIVDNKRKTIKIGNKIYTVKQYEYLNSICDIDQINGKIKLTSGKFQYHDLKICAINQRINYYDSTYLGVFEMNNPMNILTIFKLNKNGIKKIVISEIARLLKSSQGSKTNYLRDNNNVSQQDIINDINNYLKNKVPLTYKNIKGVNLLEVNFHINISYDKINELSLDPVWQCSP